jgi:signal transduction histidine kinase
VSSTLPEALESVARSWAAINGIPVEVRATGEPVPLHAEIESALLRTAQEALANVEKHASATRVGVTLSFMGDIVTLDVRDDGVGFEVSEGRVRSSSGFGLTAMRQRVSRVAGTLAIESEPGGGTAVSARVPAIGVHAP